MPKTIRLAKLKPLAPLDREAGEKRLRAAQDQLQRVQQAFLMTGERAVVVFEGWDAAGKGGTIRRIAWALDPRSLRVWPISAPSEAERREHWLQRFWRRLPERSQVAVFDRSWYGRVLVERVEGFTKKKDWKRGYDEIAEFEAMLTADGMRLVKLFLYISPEEQLKRFKARLGDPLKHWKLTYEDFRNREKWDPYVEAAEEMFERTSTKAAPWHAVQADDKHAARVAAIEIINDRLGRGLDLGPPKVDPRVAEMAERVLGAPAPESNRSRDVE